MSHFMSRQRRRAMQRLAEEADRAIESDRRFFDRWPRRSYRYRLLSSAERQQIEIAQGHRIQAAPDEAAFAAVKKLADGVRLRAVVIGPQADIGEELSDAEAGAIFEGHADANPWIRERETAMRAAFERHRDAANGKGGAQ